MSVHFIPPKPDLVPVFDWIDADGKGFGCGTSVEFEYWRGEGCLPEGAALGDVITHEPASEDQRRRIAWGVA